MRKSVTLVFALALAGCSFAPMYQRPPMPVPETWQPVSAAATPATAAVATSEWRTIFTDPRLQKVIERALAGNRDLRVAALNVERAAAAFRIQRSELLPGLGAAASLNRYRIPEKMSKDDTATTVSEWTAGVGIPTWEIDLFGRVRSLRDAALQQYFATDYARAATELSLVSAVAATYLGLAADQEMLTVAKSTLSSNQSSHDLLVKSRDIGVATDLDVNQARSLVESARADVARLEGNVRIDLNTLSLLAGEQLPPDLLPDGLGSVQPVAPVEPGLSSTVLLQRPDILAAERQLMAANANIGAARAAFLPHISLTAAAGTLSPQLSQLFGSGTGTWNFYPQIATPLWSGGALRANLAATKATRDIAVAQYEKAIQVAFAEVNDALAQRATLTDQRSAVEALVRSLEETHRLANARYEGGVDSYLQVLVVERSLFAARQNLVALRFAEQNNRITLFKVLAGEGSREAASPASEPAAGR